MTRVSLVSRGLVSCSVGASALAFFLSGLFPLNNSDGYGHLAQGRQIADLGRVPRVDLFSIWKPTPQPWSNYEWGYDLTTWLIYDHLGPTALVLTKCISLAALGAALVILAVRLAGDRPLAAPLALAGLLLALPVARFRFTVRPQIVGLLFPALLLLGIHAIYSEESNRRTKHWIIAGLALMQVVWVNTHGSHLFGLLITALFAAFAVRTPAFRILLTLFLLQILATGCSPFGFEIANDAISHLIEPAYRSALSEWSPWSPADPVRFLIVPTIVAVLVLVALKPVARSGRFGLAYGVFCVLLCVMGFRSIRFVAHQALLATPFIAAGFAHFGVFQRVRLAGLATLVALAAISNAYLTSHLVPRFGFGFGEETEGYPWACAETINRHVDAPRIFASMKNSWMLMFAVPNSRVLVDGRVPFYGPEFVQQVLDGFSDAIAFEKELRVYDINVVVIDHTRARQIPATEVLDSSPEWRLAMVEDGHSLFIRDSAADGLESLQVVDAGYRTGRILEPEVAENEIRRERALLGEHPNGDAVRAWVHALELLRPLARDADRGGFRKFENKEERALAREAAELLGKASTRYPGYSPIEMFRAMAALSACDSELARKSLGRARDAATTRAGRLIGVDIALRSGTEEERSAALAYLEALQKTPGIERDPWVTAIAEEIDVRCN